MTDTHRPPGRPSTDITERVRALADQGRTAAEIADDLKISRQRVYYVVRHADIKLDKYQDRRLRRAQTIVPRIVTGGILVPLSSTAGGTIAELLVAADLLARGWQPYIPLVRHRGHDLIACRNGHVITIEARAGHRGKAGAIVFATNPRDHSDVYAVVCTGEPVVYSPLLPD